MFSHFLLIFFRQVKKSKLHYLINLAGLAIGIAASFYLYLYCKDELSFDQFHPKSEQLYKVVDTYTFSEQPVNSATVSAPMGPALVDNIPEVEQFVRLNKVTGILKTEENPEVDFQFEKTLLVDSGFFELFGFKLREGNPHTVLTKPNSIVLTVSTAVKLFGNKNPVGQVIQTNLLGGQTMMVTGIAENPPANSHIQFDLLVSHTSMINIVPTLNHWLVYGTHTYIRVKEGTQPEDLKSKFKPLVLKNVGPEYAPKYNHHVVPVTSLHLGISRRSDLEPVGNLIIVNFLITVAILILLLSTANFISLSLSLAANRIKESGLRRALGGSSKKIASQFIFEGIAASVLCFLLALITIALSINSINVITGKTFSHADLFTGLNLVYILGAALSVGIISGSFPALLLSRLSPIAGLKNSNTVSWLGKQRIRNVLVVFQFAVVVVLLISLDVLHNQLTFLQTFDLGFTKTGVVGIPINSQQIGKNRIALTEEFAKIPGIAAVSSASSIPTKPTNFGPFRLEGGNLDDNAIFNIISADAAYVSTMELKFLAGRPFDRSIASDSTAFILNEAAIHALGIASAEQIVGKMLEMHGTSNAGPLKKGPVIGVSKNFHYKSLKEEVEPIALHIGKSGYAYFIIKLQTGNLNASLEAVRETWNKFEPDQSMIYSFFDEDIKNLYGSEEKLSNVFSLFATLTTLIACIGLFGLSSYSILRKVKEISIRKVYGANPGQIVSWISTGFLKLIALSFLIATPLAYYVSQAWLKTFAYHGSIQLKSFFIAGIIAMAITLITVSYHTLVAATTPPVKNLRSE